MKRGKAVPSFVKGFILKGIKGDFINPSHSPLRQAQGKPFTKGRGKKRIFGKDIHGVYKRSKAHLHKRFSPSLFKREGEQGDRII